MPCFCRYPALGRVLLAVVILVAPWLHRASAAGDNTAQQPTGDPFEFFSRLQSPDLSEKLEEGMARMVIMMQVLQALADATGQGPELMNTMKEALAAPTKALASKLSAAFGSDLVRLGASESGGGPQQLVVHANIGKLLDLPAAQLDSKLQDLLSSFAAEQQGHQEAQEQKDASAGADSTIPGTADAHQPNASNSPAPPTETTVEAEAQAGQASGTQSTQTRTLAQDYGDGTAGDAGGVGDDLEGDAPPPILINLSGTLVPSQQTTATVTATGSSQPSSDGSILGSVKQKVAGLLGAKQASLGAMFQDGFGSSMTVLESTMGEIRKRLIDAAVNSNPDIRASRRVEQISQIIADRLTGGEGLGRGCTPYIFNGGGNQLPEQVIFPSFSISQTTGNCALIPEIIGNAERPGEWALLSERVTCLGAATEYLLLPAIYRGSGTSTETFAAPTCRNEVVFGPQVVLTLVGDTSATITYNDRTEFLAALRTNQTSPFGMGGLKTALEAFQQKLEARKEVLSKYISLDTSTGTGEGLLAGLKDKLTKMWSDWASSSEGLHVFSQLHQDLHSSSSKAGGRGNKFGDEWKRAVADMMSQGHVDFLKAAASATAGGTAPGGFSFSAEA